MAQKSSKVTGPSSYLDVRDDMFHPHFHYEGTCSSSIIETLDEILNNLYHGTPQSFHAFYFYLFCQDDRLVPWSPHEAHQSMAVIDLDGACLRGGQFGSASVYLMHPRQTSLTSTCYFLIKETIRRGREPKRRVCSLTKLRALGSNPGSPEEPYDVAVTETREYWIRSDLGEGTGTSLEAY
ncbi:hypothetical protein BDV29DRAFT_156811 [Aspergillus leporis]|jgi:hypothetical protein|uniref:Uncharacterized protein n=1 Tax=Aspergillus leporis TaxID=41062 RepID=A0A5N5X2J3_9EURO|nr:hypothetical protein BDV29DRAFT_156811 [Aspergillus leporis]